VTVKVTGRWQLARGVGMGAIPESRHSKAGIKSWEASGAPCLADRLFCLMRLFCIFSLFGLQIYRVWVRVKVRVSVKT